MKFTKQKIDEIPVEEAHGGSGARQVLVKPEHVTSQFFEAITKEFLKSGAIFDWHSHKDIDEVFIILKGYGKFFCEDKEVEYQEGDVITIPANLNHKIEASSDSEYYFIRIKTK